MPVVDFEKARRKRAIKRSIKRLLIIAAICGLILLAFAIKNLLSGVPVWGMIKTNLTFGGSKTNFPIELSDNKYYGIDKIKNHLIVQSEIGMELYDTSGNHFLTVPYNQSQSIYRIAENDILYFSTSTNYVTVKNIYGPERKIQVENSVIKADIADDGKVAIAGFSPTSTSVVEVYRPEEEKWMFRWHDYNSIITDIIFTPDAKGILLTMIDTSDEGVLYSKIKRYDLDSKDAVFEMEFPNTMILSAQYHGNSIIVVGDNKCVAFEENKKILGEYSYENKVLQSFDNTEQNGVVLLFASYEGNNDSLLVILNDECNDVLMAKDLSEKIKALNVSKNVEYLLTDSKLQWYNNKGNLLGTMKVPPNTTYFEIIDGYGYFLSVDKLEKIPIKASKDEEENNTSSPYGTVPSTDAPSPTDTTSSTDTSSPTDTIFQIPK